MSNLNSATTYNKSGTQSPLANFSSINKLLQKNTQNTSANILKGSLDAHFNPDDYTRMFGSNKPTPTPTNQPETGFPLNTPIAPQNEGVITQPLPEDYNQFVPVDQNANWANPSDQVVARNWPTSMGGGQYITDPTQPGALIKSYRKIMDYKLSPGAKQKILGKLSPLDYQVDHIVPLWVGGADTLQNLNILDNITHEKKTAVQSVPLTLLANKKITLDQAKVMALTWKDKDASGLPIPDNGGYVPLDVAQKYAQKWEDDMKPNAWRDSLKYFGESFKENMANFGKGIPVLGEFAKGLVGGTGMVPATEALPETGTLGKVSNFAGNLLTTIVGIGLVGKGLKAAGAFGKLAQAGSTPFLKYSGTGISALDKLTGLGKTTIAAQNTLAQTRIAKVIQTGIDSATGTVDIGKAAGVSKWTGVGTNIYHSALSLAAFGQMGLLTREMTKQEEFDLSKNIKQAASDIIYGGLLGSTSRFAKGGQSLPGYAYVGGATTVWSLMQQGPNANIEEAVKEGIIMTALHGMGYRKGAVGPQEMKLNEEVYKEALNTPYQYFGDLYPLHPKNAPVPVVFTMDPVKINEVNQRATQFKKNYPDSPISKNLGPIKNTTDALLFSQEEAKQKALDLLINSKGEMSQAELEKEFTRITTSFNQLRNQTIPPGELRDKKSMDDLFSVSKAMLPQMNTGTQRTAIRSSDVLKQIDFNKIDNSINDPKTNLLFKEPSTVVGYGEKLGKEEGITIDEMAKNPDNFKPYYVGVIDENSQSLMRQIWLEQQRNPKSQGTKIVNPNATVRWFALEKTSDGGVNPRAIGYSPQEESYTKENNINKTYGEITARLQHTLTTYKNDPVKIMESINKDKVMRATKTTPAVQVDINTTTELSNRLLRGETIPEDELYSILGLIKDGKIIGGDPHIKLSQGINNVTIFNEMKDNKSNFIIGNREGGKNWMIAGREQAGEARKFLKSGYLQINGMWIPGIEPKIIDQSSMPTERSLVVPSVNTQQMSKSISEVLPKVEPVKTIPQTEKSLTVPNIVPMNPIETPKTPETNNITSALQNPPKIIPIEKSQKIAVTKPNNDLVDQFFGKIVHDIEYQKVKPDSPESLEKTYNNIIDSFKVKNPGIPEKDFKNSIKDAQSRARAYVQDLVDDMYKGTKAFGTEYTYQRNKETQVNPEYWKAIQSGLSEGEIKDLNIEKTIPKIEKLEFVSRDVKLAKEFGLKLQEPKDGYQNLELDRYGNPVFSKEYLKAHPNTKGSPLDVWGSFLGDELKANKAENSIQSQTWAKQIEQAKKSKSSYMRGSALALDKALSEKYGVKDKETGEIKYGYEESWKLNSGLKEFLKKEFISKNQEGKLLSEPYRNIMAGGTKKDYSQIQKDVAKTQAKTRALTEKAKNARENTMNSGDKKPLIPSGMSVKDPNQVQDVSNDLTPYDLLHSGLIRQEVRSDLISRYNDIIEEMKPGRRIETRLGADGEKILGTKDEMNRLFTGIKKLSEYIPESKTWKPGKKIVLKNSGEPTFEEGVNDGIKIAAEIFKLKSSPGFINFEKIKKSILDSKPDGSGGPYDGQGGILGDIGNGIGNFIQHPFASITNYIRPKEENPSYSVRGVNFTDKDLDQIAPTIALEISNRPGKDQFETNHIINTAINRALTNKKYQGSLVNTIQAPAQYQAYAPFGSKDKKGNTIESRYQKLLKGTIEESEKQKLKKVREYLNQLKNPEFKDTTGNKQFYVHARDGSFWLGSTGAEAKALANKREKELKLNATNWKTTPGFPVQVAKL